MTWVTIGVMLTAGLGLMVASWNGAVKGTPSPFLMILLWTCMSASGIYLFMLAAKKAHRLWIHEERRRKQSGTPVPEPDPQGKRASKDKHSLETAATARKLVRRVPEDASMEEAGRVLMKNLARELEIMSGILYLRKKNVFEAVATYAFSTAGEPYAFKEGEGLSGQVARDHQITIFTSLPEGYLEVCSGLGKSEPSYLAIVPFIHKNKAIAVLECSGYRYDPHDIETTFRILSRDLMEKISPNLKS